MNRLSTDFARAYLFGIIAFFSILTLPQLAFAQSENKAADPIAVFNTAQALHEKGDLAGSIEQYKNALKIEPNFPEAEYQCGVAHLALNQPAEAEQAFRRAADLRPDWTLAMTSLGSLLVQNNQFFEAERLLSRVLEQDPQNAPALAALADLRLDTKASRPALAELLAKVVILTMKANPTASIWTVRAALETALDKGDAARSSIAAALKIDPKNRKALFQMAEMALEDGDIVAAKEAAKTLQTISPNSDLLKMLNTDILVAGGGSDDIRRRQLEEQLANDQRNRVLLSSLCSAYRIADPAKALNFCRRASEAEPSNINHGVGFGAALVQAKQFDAAARVLLKIVDLAPDNATAHANLATALFELKRFAEAKTQYVWLTTKEPKLAAAYLFLGVTHDHLGEFADAAANYQEYLRLADPVTNKADIEKVNLRLPGLLRRIKK